MTVLRQVRLPGADEPTDVAFAGGVISAIGPDLPSVDDDVFEADGRWLIPGLWDHHVHMEQWALARERVDVAAGTSPAQVAALMREHGPGLTVGIGFRDALWPEAPTSDVLDAIDFPVVVISADVHTTWANRAALSLLGRPDDHWWLTETEAFELGRQVTAIDNDNIDELVTTAARAAAARGVTGVVDLELSGAIDAWQRRAAAGFDVLRVEACCYEHEFDGDLASTGTALSEFVTMGRLKLFADGSLNTRTAWCHDPYADGGHGFAAHDTVTLVAIVTAARQRGIGSTIHAIGDAAVGQALDVFEQVGGGGRIEHAQLVTERDLPRFASLGVQASVQPAHLLDDEPVAEAEWSGRTDRAYPFRGLCDAGAEILLGSDAPVARLDPWLAMDAAVNRSWHPESRLTPAEALRATTGGARLAVGAPADLALCDANPLDPAALASMTVAATWLAGHQTH